MTDGHTDRLRLIEEQKKADQVRLAVQREQATQDIGDIEALEKFVPFNRYWVGRLNALFQSRLTDSRKGATVELREKARIEANLLEELTQIPARDKKACQAMIDSPPPHLAQQPRQVT